MHSILHGIPRLTTALQEPLFALEKTLLTHQISIESWFRHQWSLHPAPLHSSVDLRNAGFKLAPVDTNLFPAGFNNLNPDFLPLCIQAAQNTMMQQFPNITRLIIIPENHTRNLFYLESLATLQEILSKAGYEVRLGSLIPALTQEQTITLDSGKIITLEPLIRSGDRVGLSNFDPELVWLNNDLSVGIPDILQGIEQPISPPPQLGWAHRLKSDHFRLYQTITEEFAQLVQIDPWLMTPLFRNCGHVDFSGSTEKTCLLDNTATLFKEIQQKYDEYGITQEPFIIIKADAGTYGMAVMSIRNLDELQTLSRKQRMKMSQTKGNQPVTKVIIQEGVYTFETWGEERAVAEPVVYHIGQHVVGGFYRVHKERGMTDNLNAPGMHFERLAFDNPCNIPDCLQSPDHATNRFYAYGVIARLAVLAAAQEITLSSQKTRGV